MLLAADSQEGRYPFHKQPYVMIQRQSTTVGINFDDTEYRFYPFEEVLQLPLIQMMKDVRGDGTEYV